jgi:hypothetical protein
MVSIYRKRRTKLMAKGVRPTWKNIVFYRRALEQSVLLNPLVRDRSGTNQ